MYWSSEEVKAFHKSCHMKKVRGMYFTYLYCLPCLCLFCGVSSGLGLGLSSGLFRSEFKPTTSPKTCSIILVSYTERKQSKKVMARLLYFEVFMLMRAKKSLKVSKHDDSTSFHVWMDLYSLFVFPLQRICKNVNGFFPSCSIPHQIYFTWTFYKKTLIEMFSIWVRYDGVCMLIHT